MIEKYADALLFEMRDAAAFTLLPDEDDRAAWAQIDERDAQRILRRAQELVQANEVPALRASSYMAYRRKGDLSGYPQVYLARREALRTLTLAQCLQPDARYIPLLTDLIWAICEETSWVLPANNPSALGDDAQPLPDPFTPLVDCAAAETAADLSLCAQLIGGTLQETAAQLVRRIVFEVRTRVIDPFATYRELEWMCGPRATVGRCVSGVMQAFLTLEEDSRRRWQCMRKALFLLDRQLCQLPLDGGVPGGLSAWQETVQPIVDCVHMIRRASGGRVDLRAEQQIQLLCHFPVLCHLARGWFVNPGEGGMRPALPARAMYRVGLTMRDQALCDLGCFLHKNGQAEEEPNRTLWALAQDLFNARAMDEAEPRPPFRREGYLPSWQLMTARTAEDESAGLAVVMHGGSNRRVDGHADVGDVLLFAGDKPVLCDGAGRESEWHSLPVVGGAMQALGANHQAVDVMCELQKNYDMMSMNLAPAYPADSAVYAWQRTLVFDRLEGGARLMEVFDLKGYETVAFHFITAQQPRIGQDYVQLGPVRMRWEGDLVAECDDAPAQDPAFEGRLYRLRFTTPQPVNGGQYVFTFTPLRTFG